MKIIVIGAIALFLVYFCRIVLHKMNKKQVALINKYISNESVDEILEQILPEYNNSSGVYDFVYKGTDIPLGRTMAFLNFFGRNIYKEEPYLYLCKRASKENDFSEYGCIVARTGVYFSEEIPSKKKKKTSERKDRSISFVGLTQMWSIGNILITVNYAENVLLDKVKIINVGERQIALIVKAIGKEIIKNNIGIYFYKNMTVEVPDYEEAFIHRETIVDKDIKEIFSVDKGGFEKTEARLDVRSTEAGIETAGIQAIKPKFVSFFGEIKNLMNGSRGHGYAAEYANDTVDRILGRDVESAAQILDEHGRQVKHGADRLVNGIEIQTKYYKTAPETIGAVFEKKEALYIRTDGSGKMMQIEVPRDQYKEALKLMQKRIDSGQVPNVEPGESAKNYVRKGYFTYSQSFNIAHSGTIESLTVDAAAGAVCCLQAAGISSVLTFALGIWRGATPKDAMKESLRTSLTLMGKGTLIYTLTMQLSRKEVANVFAGKMFTADGIAQGYRTFDNPIFELSENVANKISKSALASSSLGQKIGLDKTSGRQLIGNSITIAVVFGPDLVRSLRGRISTKQLFKNSVVGVAGMAGAAAGQAIIPIPIVGAMAGGAVAGIASKKVMDCFIEDDAKEMFRILKEEFIDQTMLSNLSHDEFDKVVEKTVGSKKISKRLQDMFQSNDYRNYARDEIVIPAIVEIIKARKLITNKQYNKAIVEVVIE